MKLLGRFIICWGVAPLLKENFLMGQYQPGHSCLHTLDARSKILATLLYMVALFLARSWQSYALMGLLFVLAVAVSRVSLRMLWKGLRVVMIFVLFTIILNFFIYPGEILWQWGFLKLTKEGLVQGLTMGYRLLLLVAIASILTLTTKPMDLTDGMERLLWPFSKVGLPSHEIAMIMSIALRFIPTILDELERIMLAQRARGADFSSKNIKTRVKQLLPLMVPLFVSAFRRADELALAMEAKCYHGGKGRTHWRRTLWRGGDTLLLAALMLLVAAFAALRWMG